MKKINKTLIAACILPIALGSTAVFAYNNSNHHNSNSGHSTNYSSDCGQSHDGYNHNGHNKMSDNHNGHNKMSDSHKGNRSHNGLYGQLNLTAEQQGQMETIRNSYQQEMNQHRDALRSLRQNERDQIQQEQFDEQAVTDLANQIGAIQVERKVAKAKYRNEMFNLLTPEQQQQMKNSRGNNNHY
ncbi:Spy/CpxP family protein refolding chaperone [Vibrio sp. SS-MA-C1-2]|uniref:Spy/CpxP family protein refolding chaperone n=1 Tax=Vibrio sp. SS-MA-C1-2 TaxID=2908646 RepID=UPI001F181CF2|nr:Spy/CpxP family protein refolding chaperone [Vibrio sp. SS-MA-C1-2]UJF19416.1 Spy/CpxP family protein refolding chaperone [Vibrio sp. SS-MA-C1-2]